MSAADTHRAITEVFRAEQAKVIAVLTRIVRDVGLAEELAQDALVAALEQWPASGIPERPAAWLMTTARNRALNAHQRARMQARKHQTIGPPSIVDIEDELLAKMDDDVRDDVLRLVFIACHPALPTEARVALTLRLVAGLTTDEIARAFLVPEATIAQRIVRAKRTIADEQLAFEMPTPDALGARLLSVLEVVYLVFNEGYAASASVVRIDLAMEALRLGRVIVGVAPMEPEAFGLLALMELQASRLPTRIDAEGEPVLLADQDRARWDRLAIRRGLVALERAIALGGEDGSYTRQASIAACHARARSFGETDWTSIANHYAALLRVAPSAVIALNHAVAVSRAEGPLAGLALLDALTSEPALARYHLLPAARADLLERLDRKEEARAEFERAAAMAENATQRARLLARADRCTLGR